MPHNMIQCATCLENRPDALRAKTGKCHNCSDTRHKHTTCFLCGWYAPFEQHHVIPQALKTNCALLVPVCLNCHSILTSKFVRRVYDNMRQQRHDNIEEACQHALQDMFDIMFDRRYQHEKAEETRCDTVLAGAYCNEEDKWTREEHEQWIEETFVDPWDVA